MRPLWQKAVIELVDALKEFQGHEYVLTDGQIGYICQDQISTKVNYGYKTLFAYFEENRNKTVTDETLESMIGLLVSCGYFSYAAIPKAYSHILGSKN